MSQSGPVSGCAMISSQVVLISELPHGRARLLQEDWLVEGPRNGSHEDGW